MARGTTYPGELEHDVWRSKRLVHSLISSDALRKTCSYKNMGGEHSHATGLATAAGNDETSVTLQGTTGREISA